MKTTKLLLGALVLGLMASFSTDVTDENCGCIMSGEINGTNGDIEFVSELAPCGTQEGERILDHDVVLETITFKKGTLIDVKCD